MRVFRRGIIFVGGMVVICLVAVMALAQYPAKGNSCDLGEYYVAAEPTPVPEDACEKPDFVNSIYAAVLSGTDENLVPITDDMIFTVESGKSREQIIDEIVAQFTWEGNEEGKEAFRQELLESGSNGWVLNFNVFGNSEE